MRSQRDNSGFTLLELVLVLAIITVVALAAAPLLSGYLRGRAPSDAAAQFISSTQFARSQAVSDGTTYRLNIDVAGGRWWLTMNSNGSFVAVDSSNGQGYTLPDNVKMQADAPVVDGVQVIEFDPSGRCDPAKVSFSSLIGNGVAEVVADAPLDVFHRAEAKR